MAGGQFGDDTGGGGADVVDVQFGLGQTGDEGVQWSVVVKGSSPGGASAGGWSAAGAVIG